MLYFWITSCTHAHTPRTRKHTPRLNRFERVLKDLVQKGQELLLTTYFFPVSLPTITLEDAYYHTAITCIMSDRRHGMVQLITMRSRVLQKRPAKYIDVAVHTTCVVYRFGSLQNEESTFKDHGIRVHHWRYFVVAVALWNRMRNESLTVLIANVTAAMPRFSPPS